MQKPPDIWSPDLHSYKLQMQFIIYQWLWLGVRVWASLRDCVCLRERAFESLRARGTEGERRRRERERTQSKRGCECVRKRKRNNFFFFLITWGAMQGGADQPTAIKWLNRRSAGDGLNGVRCFSQVRSVAVCSSLKRP